MTSETLIILISTITLLTLVCLSILLFYVFHKNKNRLLGEKQILEREVSRSQLEIREEFMRNVGKELHDNIGQVLSTVKLQLSMSPNNDQLTDSIALIGQTVNDIRNLSKVVDPDAINNLGLVESCKIEMTRLDKLDHLQAECNIIGTPFTLDEKVEIIIFRIIQESLNNSIKHAKTDKITLNLHFDKPKLNIKLKDYGVGFDTSMMKTSGSGLHNMKQRAEMIGASFDIDSEKERGTSIRIMYQMHPNDEQQNSNWNSR